MELRALFGIKRQLSIIHQQAVTGNLTANTVDAVTEISTIISRVLLGIHGTSWQRGWGRVLSPEYFAKWLYVVVLHSSFHAVAAYTNKRLHAQIETLKLNFKFGPARADRGLVSQPGGLCETCCSLDSRFFSPASHWILCRTATMNSTWVSGE